MVGMLFWSGMSTSGGRPGAPTLMPKKLLLLCNHHFASMVACAPAAAAIMASLYHGLVTSPAANMPMLEHDTGKTTRIMCIAQQLIGQNVWCLDLDIGETL